LVIFEGFLNLTFFSDENGARSDMEQRDGSQRACLERMSQEFLFTTAAAASDHTAWRKWSCGRCAYAD
jgi:hypothetical protein